MKKLVLLVVGVAFLGAAAVPAFADCAQEIKKVEDQLAKVKDPKKKEEVQDELKEAKQWLEKKNEQECMENVKSAEKLLK